MVLRVKSLNERLRHARRLQGMTQAEFAAYVGVSLRSVQNWEAGTAEPQPKTMRRLAALSGMPVAWFYEEEVAA